MDLFTDKANDILKGLLKEKVIYDSTKEAQNDEDCNNMAEDENTPTTSLDLSSSIASNALTKNPNNARKLKQLQQKTGNLLDRMISRETSEMTKLNQKTYQ
jgi:hypothetical protein